MTGNIEGTCSLLAGPQQARAPRSRSLKKPEPQEAGARKYEDEMSTYEGEAPIGDVGLLKVGDWTRTSAMQRKVRREPRSKRQDNSK